ncbi:LOW QUALITY PROTEIN: disease resistance protein RML1A [Arabidopsis lyrata subsp. lyrata]|uniref:LOW QUALITY PROTEIN: disease resistance protein RML1A n=1 Tax=Arabidopsis lyrata subsp. lyrata TaxID=81972 RepID=UPI000A29D182|nr:LOW QUALITY PROTEIN: disease resistance protein RML1A [Arabidopsis lyrata subsp. lyrata]|eukprot:XP_020872799.1 LOW QUALITY PROTEIN: disease resistance protein RML1A [Arabidopsis lyrata subsp. lyrata]
MASSSFHIRRYHVFPSFHGPDVRRGFLSHLHNHFTSKGITTFKDQEIERGQTIGPELVQAIRESRISVVVLSKSYGSSSWCLDELVEILRCKEDQGQIVMTIFYEIDTSDVRKQSGDFGRDFKRTCEGKTEEVKQRWIQALAHVATIAGEHLLNWDNEAAMVQKFATDVSNKLNLTLSRDFDGMVGMETHLRKLNSLLCLECDEVKMIGIWGPAGIGKTTIARTLFNQLSTSFRFICFMGNLKGKYKSVVGMDDYDSKLCLQNQLLSKILGQRDMRVHNLGAIKEWLQDQRVLIILDDVDDIEKLEALAKEPSWFGSGSRIIVTTEDKKILKAHWVDRFYLVDFPSEEEALEILCLSAFKQSTVRDGFMELANKIVEFCGYLPLGLSVVGSSLRGESKHEWELQLSRIGTSLDRKIEDVLRVGYDKLSKKDQSLFLHIACFFNSKKFDHVTTLLADSNLDVSNGLKTLVEKSLISICWWIEMHRLLEQLGRQIVIEQSDEPGKRQFLVEAEEIRDVLENETGTGSVIGISFDMSKNVKLSISKRAFEGMRNLKFLRFYKADFCPGNVSLRILEDIDYLPRLRLLDWYAYPGKRLPPTFQPEYLIELHMKFSKLEKLWEGIQPLKNLKEIDLSFSYKLKEIPDLSNASKLKILTLSYCTSLVKLPSSISNLQKLKKLNVSSCEKLKVIPTNINLASLEEVDMSFCSLLRSFPDISRNIKKLNVVSTQIEKGSPSSFRRLSCLEELFIGGRSLERLTHVPVSLKKLDISHSGIEKIPDCVLGLQQLQSLIVESCTKLVSLTSLPPSLVSLNAKNCVSLERVCCSFQDPIKDLRFYNCLKLDEEARRAIIHQRGDWDVCLPGKEVPAEFTHKAIGNSITTPLVGARSRFEACLLLPPTKVHAYLVITCCIRSKGGVQINEFVCGPWPSPQWPEFVTEHLLIFRGELYKEKRSPEVDGTMSEILFEFSCDGSQQVMECGVHILRDEAASSSEISMEEAEDSSSSSKMDNFETESSSNRVDYYESGGNSNHYTDGDGNRDYKAEASKVSQVESTKTSKHTGCWSWFTKHGLRKKKLNKTEQTSCKIS